MDFYADDLHELFEHLELKGVMMVGHSKSGVKVTRFIGHYGTCRVRKAVLVSAIPPHGHGGPGSQRVAD
jgi:non-heme chloroperoxidase